MGALLHDPEGIGATLAIIEQTDTFNVEDILVHFGSGNISTSWSEASWTEERPAQIPFQSATAAALPK